jgi:hypothetical protein
VPAVPQGFFYAGSDISFSAKRTAGTNFKPVTYFVYVREPNSKNFCCKQTMTNYLAKLKFKSEKTLITQVTVSITLLVLFFITGT